MNAGSLRFLVRYASNCGSAVAPVALRLSLTMHNHHKCMSTLPITLYENTRPRIWCSSIAPNKNPYKRNHFGCSRHCQRGYSSKFGTACSGQRSPHAVLQIKTNATKSEIKAAFRELAKQHHPDLKMYHDDNDDGVGGDQRMVELITAYETLMNKHSEHFWTDARDSKVALACEMYTVEELRSMHRVFDVYSFRINFNGDLEDATKKFSKSKGNEALEYNLDLNPIVPLPAHPDDSISDLKRKIQSCFADAWGLNDRMIDRDGLFLGWELVHYCNTNGKKDSDEGTILSYHLFIHSYGIQEGDLLHAVVRKNHEMQY